MAEAIAANIAGAILRELNSYAVQKIGGLWGVQDELRRLKNTMTTLQAGLVYAESRYYESQQMKDWLDRVKDVVYDAQDLIEEFSIEAKRLELRSPHKVTQQVHTFFSSSNQLLFRLKMGTKLREIREDIESIAADKRFLLEEHPVSLQVEWQKRREQSHSFVREDEVIGRDNDKKAIMRFLLEAYEEERVSVLPVVGIGGIGKTTLVQCVFNDVEIGHHFEGRIWVCVSDGDGFDLRRVVKQILASVGREVPDLLAMEQLQNQLRREIDGKRYLLVLDDVWNDSREKWLGLKTLLMGGGKGSRIVVTTRSLVVARITGTVEPYHVEGLSESKALDLLMRMASRTKEEERDLEKLSIGREIVKQCGGVPLAIRVIGGLLLIKETKAERLHFKDYDLPKVSWQEDGVMSCLRLSYDLLPSPLKQCFAFCSLFPKDYEINKQILILLWMAQGFVQPIDGFEHMEDIADGYFKDLYLRNLFQDQMEGIFGLTCKMHDLVNDLACSVAGVQSANLGTKAEDADYAMGGDYPRLLNERTRHISDSILDLSRELPLPLLKVGKLRTFLSTVPAPHLYLEKGERLPISKAACDQLFSCFKSMRALDMHDAKISKLPGSIGRMLHLTYLDLSYNEALERLPSSITKLQNLQTLKLTGCFVLKELPRNIKNLVSLRHLYVDYCDALTSLPCGLGTLTNLHTLTNFILPHLESIPRHKNYSRFRELGQLNNLRGEIELKNLRCSGDAEAESLAANLKGKQFLESITLSWCDQETDELLLEGLQPHPNLKRVDIRFYGSGEFPRWMRDNLSLLLPNLVEIRFSFCLRCKKLPLLGSLPFLKSLDLSSLKALECIESHDQSSTSSQSFPSLSQLTIIDCPNLKSMPPFPRLESLTLNKVNKELFVQSFGLLRLRHLHIYYIEFLECLPEEWLRNLSSLLSFVIMGCQKLISLSRGIRHLHKLIYLSIRDCVELDLFKDENGNVMELRGLESLKSLVVENIPKLTSLPDLLLQVTSLESLCLQGCHNLVELPEWIGDFNSLGRLEIVRCHSLTSLPQGIQLLASLQYLRIAGCPNLEERCLRVSGEDWHKIAHIPHISFKLESYEQRIDETQPSHGADK